MAIILDTFSSFFIDVPGITRQSDIPFLNVFFRMQTILSKKTFGLRTATVSSTFDSHVH